MTNVSTLRARNTESAALNPRVGAKARARSLAPGYPTRPLVKLISAPAPGGFGATVAMPHCAGWTFNVD